MESAIRHQSGTAAPPSSVGADLQHRSESANAPSSVAFDFAGIDEEEIDKKPKTIR